MQEEVLKINQAMVALLDQNDVAAILKVSPKTLEYWRCKGMGPRYAKIGKFARYFESDVLDFAKNLVKGGNDQ